MAKINQVKLFSTAPISGANGHKTRVELEAEINDWLSTGVVVTSLTTSICRHHEVGGDDACLEVAILYEIEA